MQVDVCDFSQWDHRREPEPLNLGGLGKLLGTGLLGGVASGIGAEVSQDILGNNR